MNAQPPFSPAGETPGVGEVASAPLVEQAKLSIVDLWHIVRMRYRVVLGVTLSLMLVVGIITFSLTPLYTGTAVVMLDQRQTNTVNMQAVLSGLPTDQSSVLNQVQILTSRDLAARVIDRLRLDQDPEFAPSPLMEFVGRLNPLKMLRNQVLTPAQQRQLERDSLVDAFEKRLSVAQLQLSTAIEIDFQSDDPERATLIANTIADAYVEDQLNAKFDATEKATKWLASRLGELGTQAAVAAAAVQRYKNDNHLTDVTGAAGTGSMSITDERVRSASDQLTNSESARAIAVANAEHVEKLVAAGRASEVPEVVASPLIAQLRTQQASLAGQQGDMASRYGAEHPKMLALAAQRRDLDNKINDEIKNIVASVEHKATEARVGEGTLRSQLSGLEQVSSVQGQARVKLAQLQADAESSRALYDSFVARSKETQQQEGLQVPDARIISHAQIPVKASFPNKLLVLGVTLPAALMLGFLIAFIMERTDSGFRTVSRVEETLGYPVLATIPDMTPSGKEGVSKDGAPGTAADQIIDRPLSSYAEAVRGLHLGLTLSNVDRAPKVVMVTSAVPSEGKTTVALSLARHVAQTGRSVVLVDADLRRPAVHTALGLDGEKRNDLIDVLSAKVPLDQALVKDPRSSVVTLPTLQHVKNAPDLLDSQAMAKLINHLRSTFDLVIIDSAPILPVTDTKVLVRLVDTVLYVVRWEKTPRDASAEAIKALRALHTPIAGVALTRADTKRFHYYSFGYGGGYYYNYSRYYQN